MDHNLFRKWPKTPRLEKEWWDVTEKLDGTNACVIVTAGGEVMAQSRSKIITPGKTTDNHGFAQWVEDNKEELKLLGVGYHFGEWWGQGINRGYGLKVKRFSLFNMYKDQELIDCCSIVPFVGIIGELSLRSLQLLINNVMHNGSLAVPGFKNFEGLVVQSSIYSNVRYKYIINK